MRLLRKMTHRSASAAALERARHWAAVPAHEASPLPPPRPEAAVVGRELTSRGVVPELRPLRHVPSLRGRRVFGDGRDGTVDAAATHDQFGMSTNVANIFGHAMLNTLSQ